MQKSMVKNSIYNVLYTTINVFFPLATSVYSARILLASGIGTVVYSQNIASYFATFAALGLPSYGVREFAKVRENIVARNRLFTELILLNFISTSVSVIFYVLFLHHYMQQVDLQLYIASGAVILFNYLNVDWLYRGLEEYGYITSRSLFIKILSFAFLAVFVKDQTDYILYAWISSLAIGSNHLFNVLYARKFVLFNFSKINLLKHVRSLIPIALIIFFGSIYSKVDVTMLGMLATVESVGYYNNSQKIITMVLTVSNAITGAFLPRLSYCYSNDSDAFYALLNKGFDILCLITLPLVAGLYLVAEDLVVLLYGISFSPMIYTIRLLCPIIIIKGFGDLLCYQLAYSTKNEKIIIPASGCAAALNVFGNAILIPVFQQNGAVIASLLSEFLTNALQFAYIKKKVKYHLNWRSLLISGGATLCMAISVMWVVALPLPTLLSIIVAVLCGITVYITANIALKNPLVIEILRWLMNKIKHHTI